jgi:F0F1-type ATP synthase assembly protein I
MDTEKDPNVPKNTPGHKVNSFSIARIGIYIGLMTVAIVVVAVFGGIWLDNTLGTKPLFILILVLGSMPISIWLSYTLAVRSVKNVIYTGPKSGAIKPNKEEEDNGD